MSAQRYTLPAIALHWVHAAIILALLWLGWTMIDLPKGAERTAAYGQHKSLGLLALLLFALRMAWRARHAPPPALARGWEGRLATATHHALYLCLLLAPLCGYFASSFSQYPLRFFGWEVVKLGWPDESINGVFKLAHEFFGWALAALIILHIAGALKHVIRGDGALKRMLPGRGA